MAGASADSYRGGQKDLYREWPNVEKLHFTDSKVRK